APPDSPSPPPTTSPLPPPLLVPRPSHPSSPSPPPPPQPPDIGTLPPPAPTSHLAHGLGPLPHPFLTFSPRTDRVAGSQIRSGPSSGHAMELIH
uniref:Uncharacterized protein n=1 Tax=Triticum urartu TaxID=4572 RepID=A0A8R7TFZ0_TRIUA